MVFMCLTRFEVCVLYFVFFFAGQAYYLNIHTKESQWEVPEEAAKSSPGPDQVQCSHLLVKHRDSRRPASWREDNITRSKEEAIELLKGESLSQIRSDARFALVSGKGTRSD